jgi:hypothetical protein
MNYLALAVLALGIPLSSPAPSRVQPVRVGTHGQPDLDACLSLGQTTSPVVVRLAPSDSASAVVSLRAGQEVHLCGSSKDGTWESVVIPGKAGEDCGVSSAVPTPQIYSGPCRSGWIPSKRIRGVAG